MNSKILFAASLAAALYAPIASAQSGYSKADYDKALGPTDPSCSLVVKREAINALDANQRESGLRLILKEGMNRIFQEHSGCRIMETAKVYVIPAGSSMPEAVGIWTPNRSSYGRKVVKDILNPPEKKP